MVKNESRFLYLYRVFKITNYFLILYFFIGACFPKGDFSQMLKISDLMEHYDLHKQQAQILGQSMTFPEFLYIHFVNVDEHEEDHHGTHDDLPFQQFNSGTNSFLIDAKVWPGALLPALNSKEDIFGLIQFRSSDFLSTLFRPPTV